MRGKTVKTVKSVLVCEEDPIIRARVKSILRDQGFDTIYECSDGESAMKMACECLPNIAFIDAMLPQNSGLNTACGIRQKLKIPVILLLSYCDPDMLNGIKKIGITTILNKPFREQDLLPAMEMAIAHAEEVEILKDLVEYLIKTIESRKIIDKAKVVLLRQGLSESGAFRKIQKLAMDKQKSMHQIAEAILLTEGA